MFQQAGNQSLALARTGTRTYALATVAPCYSDPRLKRMDTPGSRHGASGADYSIPFVDNTLPANRSSNIVA